MTHIGDDGVELSPDEIRAIRSLKRLAKTWPTTLWLFNNGQMTVMRVGVGGEQIVTPSGGVDSRHVVETIIGIPSEGGGW